MFQVHKKLIWWAETLWNAQVFFTAWRDSPFTKLMGINILKVTYVLKSNSKINVIIMVSIDLFSLNSCFDNENNVKIKPQFYFCSTSTQSILIILCFPINYWVKKSLISMIHFNLQWCHGLNYINSCCNKLSWK